MEDKYNKTTKDLKSAMSLIENLLLTLKELDKNLNEKVRNKKDIEAVEIKDEFTKKKIGLEELFKYEESKLRGLIVLQFYDLAGEYRNKINLTIEEEKIRLSNNVKGLKNRQDKESS